MKKKLVTKTLFTLVCMLLVLPCKAASVGQVAQDFNEPIYAIARLIHGICAATGMGLCVAAIVRYTEYRRNGDARLSVIIFLFLTGLALIGIGFLPFPK